MHVTDYWKKIINEIILIKESDIQIDDSAILVGGGGFFHVLRVNFSSLVDFQDFRGVAGNFADFTEKQTVASYDHFG